MSADMIEIIYSLLTVAGPIATLIGVGVLVRLLGRK